MKTKYQEKNDQGSTMYDRLPKVYFWYAVEKGQPRSIAIKQPSAQSNLYTPHEWEDEWKEFYSSCPKWASESAVIFDIESSESLSVNVGLWLPITKLLLETKNKH